MRADRLLSLMLLLQTRGRMTAQQLADELEVSERTIYRDLDALSLAGIPVYAERGPHGGCALLDNYRTSLTGLTEAEVTALFTAILPNPAQDLGANQTLQQAVLKLTAALPARQQDQADEARRRIHLDPAPWFQPMEPAPHLAVVQAALWQQQKLRLLYRRADGNWVKRLLSPYGLVAKTSIWYVVGETMRSVQVYRVSRIQEAILTDHAFVRPAQFDLAAFWQDWCARFEASQSGFPVTLRVHWNQANELIPVFGEGIHQTLAAAGEPDEQGYLTLKLTFGGADEARRALLGLGATVTVVEPAELRQELIEQAQMLLMHYRLARSHG